MLLATLEDHFIAREQPDQAIEVLRRAVAGSKSDLGPRFHLAKLYYRLEMLDDALAEFTALQERVSAAPILAYYMAKIHERRNRFDQANTCYRRIVREQNLLASQFRCLTCGRDSRSWSERCAACGQWNTVNVDLQEELSIEELGLSSAPVYSADRS